MNKQTLLEAEAEAKRFLERLQAVKATQVRVYQVRCGRQQGICGGLHTCQTNKKSARKYGLESGWTNAEGDKKTWYCGGCMKVINERVELVKRVKNGR